MGTHVKLACFIVLLSCLLPSATSEHKKKIIVKVPHLIKHIHHDHFKPIHLHKVHAKKVEHYYHDEHENTPSGWKHGQKKKTKENKKLHGSFSDLKPILIHQKIEEHMEYPEGDYGVHEFDQNQRVGHRLEFEQVPRQFGPEENWWSPEDRPAKRRSKFREEGFNRGENNFKRENIRPKPIEFSSFLNEDDRTANEYSGETWDIPNEDLAYTRKRQKNPNNENFFNYERKNKKPKQFNWRSEEVSSELESDGWKPIVDFNAWKHFDDMKPHINDNHNKHFIDSGEYMTDISNEDFNHLMQKEITDNNQKKRRKQNRKKNKKLNNVIKGLNQDVNHEQEQKLPQRPYQIESPQIPVLPQIRPQFFQPLPIQQIQPYSIPLPQAQKTWHQPIWPTQHPAESVWQTQPLPQHQPQPQTAVAPKMVWSGHHLQMPQHSMWHVQQHSDGAPSLQVLTSNQNPLQTLQFHQQHSLPQQLTQESSPVHKVVPPDWPLTQKSQDSSVKQHWEQHVQTSGSDGPASSYRVEVINYTGNKSTR